MKDTAKETALQELENARLAINSAIHAINHAPNAWRERALEAQDSIGVALDTDC